MFEQEIEMEKQQSSVVPLLLIVALTLGIVGVAAYYIIESRKVLTHQEAVSFATAVLHAQGAATVSFHTGLVQPSVNERPDAAHYRLLQKAGLLELRKAKGASVSIRLTPQAEQLFAQIPNLTQSAEKDGTLLYTVPLAQRNLASVININMVTPQRANVSYTWVWEPNALGETFDAAGSTVRSFSTWDRATLIEKHGVNFYHQPPQTSMITVVKSDKGWQLAND